MSQSRVAYWVRSWYETLKLHYLHPNLEAELLDRLRRRNRELI